MTDRMAIFHQWLKERGLKSTSQRDDIAQVFFATSRHINVEELYAEVRKINPRVGYATVYRTLKLLKECGLAAERHFADGEARFENVQEEGHHHHLLCDHCGKIVEFTHPQLEKLLLSPTIKWRSTASAASVAKGESCPASGKRACTNYK
jgi:Fur family transcriptional regulator, ferric uptake regulator